MALSALKDDLKWIDPQTGEANCTQNTCRLKFNASCKIEIQLNPHSQTKKFLIRQKRHQECNECGRMVMSQNDRNFYKSSKSLLEYDDLDYIEKQYVIQRLRQKKEFSQSFAEIELIESLLEELVH